MLSTSATLYVAMGMALGVTLQGCKGRAVEQIGRDSEPSVQPIRAPDTSMQLFMDSLATDFLRRTEDFCEMPRDPRPIADASELEDLPIGDGIERMEGNAFVRRLNVQPVRCVIRDSTEWNTIRRMFQNTGWAERTFDFEHVQLAIAAYGFHSTTGVRISISDVRETGGTIEIHVLVRRVGGGCIVGDMTMSPFAAVTFKRSSKPVVFKEAVLEGPPC